MDVKSILKSSIPHIIAIAAMILVSSIYFYPAWEGKSIQKDDSVEGRGRVREVDHYKRFKGETILWNNSAFSGMPEFVYAPYSGASKLEYIYNLPKKLGIPREISVLFWYMLGFYILLLSINASPLISLFGAIAFSLTTYNLDIIEAGHYTKIDTIIMIPPTLGGILLCFKKKYIIGLIITSFFLAMQINMAHTQMTYYFGISVIIIGLTESYYHIKEKQYITLLKSAGVLLLAALLAAAPNYARLSELAKYNQHSIRGKSELTINNEKTKTKNGLDKDYINVWSSGRTETMMLFVPRVKGGATDLVKNNRELLNRAQKNERNIIGNTNQYWGNQPYTGAPMYVGAVLFLIFFIGLFIIKERLKYGILFSVTLMVLLSMGGNLSWFTDFFIENIPLYNKFRVPASILAIVAILTTFFAFYTLMQIVNNRSLLTNTYKIFISKKPIPLYIIGGSIFILFLLLNIAFPNLLNSFLSNNELTQLNKLLENPNSVIQVEQYINILTEFRTNIFRAELWRTLFLGILTIGILYLYAKNKINPTIIIISIGILAIIDLWTIDLRYVNKSAFTKKNVVKQRYRLSDTDKQIYEFEIKKNPDLLEKFQEANSKYLPQNEQEKEAIETFVINNNTHYRVLNMTTSPFNENVTANAHRSIGGYVAYKLRRYQDIIEHHLSKNNIAVLNMLNTKYIITSKGIQINPSALGAAWYVDSIYWAKDANDEILSLNEINTSNTATVNLNEKGKLKEFSVSDADDHITLVSYHPEHMIYESKTLSNNFAVFSEISYPDWEVFIDGEKTNFVTTNYILRGIIVPKGKHKIEFIFHPKHFYRANTISDISLYLFGIVIIISILLSLKRKHNLKNEKAQ